MTETTPIQRLFLGMSLLVFTSMILFQYGVRKPNYASRYTSEMQQSLFDSGGGGGGLSRENRTNDTVSSPVIFISEENYIINQVVNVDLDAESAMKVSYQQAKLANCTHRLCEVNFIRVPPVMREDTTTACHGIIECVTIVIKTATRLQNTVKLVSNILDLLPKINIVVVDDVNTTFTHDEKWSTILSEQDTVTYLQVIPGLSNGRDLGLRVATTPYILILDDDYLFTKNTNIKKMLAVLRSSDISVVAGTVGQPWSFEGAIKMYTNKTGAYLRHYPAVYYEALPGFVNCFMVDVVKSFMMIRRSDVIKAPVWDKRRPLFEHMDLAINMRLNRRKVAYCPGIMTEHLSTETDRRVGRYLPYISKYRAMFLEKWNLTSFFACPRDSYLKFSSNCSIKRDNS